MYQILRRDKASDLTLAVGAYLNDGWEPLGGVSVVAFENNELIWAQAIVKRDSSETQPGDAS